VASGASGACLRSHAAADPVQNVGLAGNEFDIVTVLPLQVLQLLGDGLLQRRNVAVAQVEACGAISVMI